jgi:hypothetical protein
MRKRSTTIMIPDDLLLKLKHQVLEERTDVSSLLCRLAEEYLKHNRREIR